MELSKITGAISLLFGLLLGIEGNGQSSEHNYVKTYTALEEHTGDLSLVNNKNKVQESIQYYDGLGRLIQTVTRESSPGGYDVVAPVVYDDFGREKKAYLPYVSTSSTSGAYHDNAITAQSNFYDDFYTSGVGSVAFSEKVYEPSPLNRVLEQGAPGASWQVNGSATVEFLYDINTSGDGVKIWNINTSGLPASSSSYVAGELHKTITIDEEDHQIQEFKDKLGRTILKRVQGHKNDATTEEWADTYYIYDDFGNLRYVLPPMANQKLNEGVTLGDVLSKWAFSYVYDGRKRMVEKRVPGAAWVYMVYDSRDRLVLTQDGKQRPVGDWTFTKYDQLNRPILTGIYAHGAVIGRSVMQGRVNSYYETADMPNTPEEWYEERTNTGYGYTDLSFPRGVDVNKYLSVTYYDDYSFKTLFGTGYNYSSGQLGSPFPSSEFETVKGQVTGGMTRVLDGSNKWLRSVTYYDDRYRVIQTITENYHGAVDHFSTLYNFAGWVLSTNSSYRTGGTRYETKKRYTYDHAGRLKAGYHQLFINGSGQGEVLLAENKYNELGELIEKNLHVENNVPHQSIDYRYNIRGWLESVNNSTLQIEPGRNEDDAKPDFFGMELFYDVPLSGIPTGG